MNLKIRKLRSYLIGILLVFGLLSSCSSKKEQKPNVIFFLVDDLGWVDVGLNGSKFYETPNIDKFATEGVQFTNAYAAAHVCSPTLSLIHI